MSEDNLLLTDAAAAKVWSLMDEEGNYDLKLRAFVTGGGCSGYKYGFTFDETQNADDMVVSKTITLNDGKTQTIYLLVDALSYMYLANAEIDYQDDIQGEQFIIRNPNAKTTCGCGSSFAME